MGYTTSYRIYLVEEPRCWAPRRAREAVTRSMMSFNRPNQKDLSSAGPAFFVFNEAVNYRLPRVGPETH